MNQRRRGFQADAFHARHVIGTIAHQREDIADLGGFYLFCLPQGLDIQCLVVVNVQHRDARAEELLEVLVFRDDCDVDMAGCRFVKDCLCYGGDDVVCLQRCLAERQDAECSQHLFNAGNLRHQICRWR